MAYVTRMYLFVLAGAVLAAGAILAPSAALAKSGGNFEVNDASDGGVDVKFKNGCWIKYDSRGKRGGHVGSCTKEQYVWADKAASSRLNVGSSGNSGSENYGRSGGPAVPTGQMQRYCQGEASATLSVRPTEIRTSSMERRGNRYVVEGQTPPGGSNATTFECVFDKHGVFEQVVVTSRAHDQRNTARSEDIPKAAKKKCRNTFGDNAKITQVSALRPGFWEVIMQNKSGSRSAACTVTSEGQLEDWTELN